MTFVTLFILQICFENITKTQLLFYYDLDDISKYCKRGVVVVTIVLYYYHLSMSQNDKGKMYVIKISK